MGRGRGCLPCSCSFCRCAIRDFCAPLQGGQMKIETLTGATVTNRGLNPRLMSGSPPGCEDGRSRFSGAGGNDRSDIWQPFGLSGSRGGKPLSLRLSPRSFLTGRESRMRSQVLRRSRCHPASSRPTFVKSLALPEVADFYKSGAAGALFIDVAETASLVRKSFAYARFRPLGERRPNVGRGGRLAVLNWRCKQRTSWRLPGSWAGRIWRRGIRCADPQNRRCRSPGSICRANTCTRTRCCSRNNS